MPGPPDPIINFDISLNEPIRQVSADKSNWLIGTVKKVSRGFESQTESFSRKSLETLGILV